MTAFGRGGRDKVPFPQLTNTHREEPHFLPVTKVRGIHADKNR
jgi:hypothetical protein